MDHRDHEAIVAVDPAAGGVVGVARYVRDRERPGSAEIAVIVTDAWQGHGVSSALLWRLADRALAEGVTRFTGLMLTGNRPMARLFAALGEPRVVSRDGGTVELAVEIGPTSSRRDEQRGRRASSGSAFSRRRKLSSMLPGNGETARVPNPTSSAAVSPRGSSSNASGLPQRQRGGVIEPAAGRLGRRRAALRHVCVGCGRRMRGPDVRARPGPMVRSRRRRRDHPQPPLLTAGLGRSASTAWVTRNGEAAGSSEPAACDADG